MLMLHLRHEVDEKIHLIYWHIHIMIPIKMAQFVSETFVV